MGYRPGGRLAGRGPGESQFRDELRGVLDEVGPRIKGLKNDPEIAWDMFEKFPVDLVLSDWTEDLDGIAFLRRVRQSEASVNPFVPVSNRFLRAGDTLAVGDIEHQVAFLLGRDFGAVHVHDQVVVLDEVVDDRLLALAGREEEHQLPGYCRFHGGLGLTSRGFIAVKASFSRSIGALRAVDALRHQSTAAARCPTRSPTRSAAPTARATYCSSPTCRRPAT